MAIKHKVRDELINKKAIEPTLFNGLSHGKQTLYILKDFEMFKTVVSSFEAKYALIKNDLFITHFNDGSCFEIDYYNYLIDFNVGQFSMKESIDGEYHHFYYFLNKKCILKRYNKVSE